MWSVSCLLPLLPIECPGTSSLPCKWADLSNTKSAWWQSGLEVTLQPRSTQCLDHVDFYKIIKVLPTVLTPAVDPKKKNQRLEIVKSRPNKLCPRQN